MKVMKEFKVFGEPVKVFATSEATDASFALIHQISPPGGGPPPHVHRYENEIFTVIEGEYEFFDGKTWHPVAKGETVFSLRGQVHTYRNSGTVQGTMQTVIAPGTGFEQYLEAISTIEMPREAVKLKEISDKYGIRFVMP